MCPNEARVKARSGPEVYSAKIVRSDGGEGRVYRDGARRRTESKVAQAIVVTIANLDERVMYSIHHDSRTVVQTSLSKQMLKSLQDDSDNEWCLIEEQADASWYHVFEKQGRKPITKVKVDNATGLTLESYSLDKNGKHVLHVKLEDVSYEKPERSLFLPPRDYEVVR